MRKIITIILSLVILFTMAFLVGCGNGSDDPEMAVERTPRPTADDDTAQEATPATASEAVAEQVEVDLTRQGIDNARLVAMVRSGEIPANVTHLTLIHNEISDLTPLASLTNLEQLYLNANEVSDLSPLAGLTNLRRLIVWGNPIDGDSSADWTPVEHVLLVWGRPDDATVTATPRPTPEPRPAPHIILPPGYIVLRDQGITDEQLAVMVSTGEIPADVVNLDLSSNQISDLSPLQNLTQLTVLSLVYNQISDLTPLASLTNLESINLFGNLGITDWSPVEHVENVNR